MRRVVIAAAMLLVAGCSHTDERGEQYRPLTPIPSTPATTTTPTSTGPSTTSAAATPPAAGAPIAALTAWVQAGTAAATQDFHTATRDGQTTQLGDDIAFVTPSGTSKCMTNAANEQGVLTCLVALEDPPARPSGAEGNWVGNWVDFTGTEVRVGSLHGDPGRFGNGYGPDLTYGSSLRFGDFGCRSDPTGLFCVNFATGSGVRLSDAGVEPFGCLRATASTDDVGRQLACP